MDLLTSLESQTRCLPEYTKELINFRVALEQGLLGVHLGKYATHRPNID